MDQQTSVQPPPRQHFPWRHVIISVIVAAIISGIAGLYIGVYLFDQDRWALRTDIDDLRDRNAQLDRKVKQFERGRVLPKSSEQAQIVVESFLKLTLPPEPIDYTNATLFLNESLSSKLREDISAIPRWYGIQDGPDHTRVLDVEAYQDTASAIVGAYYGDIAGRTYDADRIWEFGLQYTDATGWLITSIKIRE